MVRKLDWSAKGLTDEDLGKELDNFHNDEVEVSVLILKGNKLTKIPQLTNREIFCNLKELNLSGNKIAQVDVSYLPSTITKLNISDNKLTKVPDTSKLNKLVVVDVQCNSIIGCLNGQNFPEFIKKIIAEKNQLTSIADMSHLNCLEDLRLGENHLHSVYSEDFPLNIKSMGLQSNQLTTIPNFSQLECLKYLDIGVNDITEISGTHLNVDIEYAIFSECKLHSISQMSHLVKLEVLSIESNKLTQLPDLPEKIKIVLASNNNISSVNTMLKYECLEHLDLSDNKLREINAEDLPPNLYVNISSDKLDNNESKTIESFSNIDSVWSGKPHDKVRSFSGDKKNRCKPSTRLDDIYWQQDEELNFTETRDEEQFQLMGKVPVIEGNLQFVHTKDAIKIFGRSAYCFPQPDREWYKDGIRIQEDNRHSFQLSKDPNNHLMVLVIESPGPLSSGVYKYVVSNDHGEDSREITVPGRPEIISFPKDVIAMAGKPIYMVCTFQQGKEDQANIKWLKNGIAIKLTASGFQLQNTPSSDTQIPSCTKLSKEFATLTDSGLYKCVIENNFRRAEETVEVIVTDQDEIGQEASQVHTVEDEAINKMPIVQITSQHGVTAEKEWPKICKFLDEDKKIEVFSYYLDEVEEKVIITAKTGAKVPLETQLSRLSVPTYTYVIIERSESPKLLCSKFTVKKWEYATEYGTFTGKVKDSSQKEYLMTSMHLFQTTPGTEHKGFPTVDVKEIIAEQGDLGCDFKGVFDRLKKGDGTSDEWWIDIAVVPCKEGKDYGLADTYKKCHYLYNQNCDQIKSGCEVFKIGATSGKTTGKLCSKKGTFKYKKEKARAYVVKSEKGKFLEDGDSGSLVTTEIDDQIVGHYQQNHALGIAFASDSVGCYILPLNLCLEKLNANCETTFSFCSKIENCPIQENKQPREIDCNSVNENYPIQENKKPRAIDCNSANENYPIQGNKPPREIDCNSANENCPIQGNKPPREIDCNSANENYPIQGNKPPREIDCNSANENCPIQESKQRQKIEYSSANDAFLNKPS